MQKNIWDQSQNHIGLKKAYFWEHPLMQAVEAHILRYFNNIFIFLVNIPSVKKSAAWIHYELI